ncbi:MAG: Crp/Fnr family transcriptional regulator, partial [Nitrospinota bacterium]
MDRFLALRQIPLFASLDDVALKNLSKISSYKVYKKNEVIFHLGDEGSTLFILNSGSVKIFLNDDKGKEMILKILYKGDFFGEMSLLDGQFRSANVMSVEPSKALIIQREDFLRLIESNPEIALNTMISLSRRLRKIDEKVASLAFLDSYGKVARFLLDFM